MKSTNSREQIDLLIAAGEASAAQAALVKLWRADRSPAAAGFVAARFERLAAQLQAIQCRVFILRSFTVEPVLPLLRAEGAAAGIHVLAETGDFNAYAQEMLNTTSRLYSFGPQVVILAVQTRDVAPDLWEAFTDLNPAEVDAAVERVEAEFRNWIGAFRSRSNASLVVHLFEAPASSAGILDTQTMCGQVQAVHELNERLKRISQESQGVYVLDYDALVARHGRRAWHDERKWQSARLPVSAHCLVHLAQEWMRFIHPLTGRICKVLVTDLDNTLWGGVIGEDGLDGIHLDREYPGAAFRNLQRAILDLHRRGLILAVCSKNNPRDALEAIEQHPHMVLRADHFSSLRINWEDKVTNLREIANELNVGLEAFAFLDDSKVEREWVRRQLPQVEVIDLPEDPVDYADTLRACPVFERLSLSEEDRSRTHYYERERQRNELRNRTNSLDSFYRSLEMKLTVGTVGEDTLARVAQLTQKTNQFNLTTRRLSEQQIATMVQDQRWRIYWARLKDRFGDNGVIGVMIARLDGEIWDLDTFLMSCRVIGRTVETAMLAYLSEAARKSGARRLLGTFLPTAKNGQVADFFLIHRFRCIEEQGSCTRWDFDLTQDTIAAPSWIDITALAEGEDS